MAQGQEGWPLGLLPLNARIGLVRNHDLSGSASFSTLLTDSPSSSTLSSSDLDTESTGSFLHDGSITQKSLIGVVSNIPGISQRSTRRRRADNIKDQKIYRTIPWLFSLCPKLSTDAVDTSSAPASLRHFLEAEKRAANVFRKNRSSSAHKTGDFNPLMAVSETNSTFVGGQLAPHSAAALGVEGNKRKGREMGHCNGHGVSIRFPRMCGQLVSW